MAFTFRDLMMGIARSAPAMADSIYRYQDQQIQERQLANQERQTEGLVGYYEALTKQTGVETEEKIALLEHNVRTVELKNKLAEIQYKIDTQTFEQNPERFQAELEQLRQEIVESKARVSNYKATTRNIDNQTEADMLLNDLEYGYRAISMMGLVYTLSPEDQKIWDSIVKDAPKNQNGSINWRSTVETAVNSGVRFPSEKANDYLFELYNTGLQWDLMLEQGEAQTRETMLNMAMTIPEGEKSSPVIDMLREDPLYKMSIDQYEQETGLPISDGQLANMWIDSMIRNNKMMFPRTTGYDIYSAGEEFVRSGKMINPVKPPTQETTIQLPDYTNKEKSSIEELLEAWTSGDIPRYGHIGSK